MAALLMSFYTGSSIAAGEVSELTVLPQDATPASIVADGVTLNWGQAENLLLEGFVADNETFTAVRSADKVAINRRDLPGVAEGELCGVFAERVSVNAAELKPDLPARFTGSTANPSTSSSAQGCDMSALLMSTHINRGTLDTFSNVGENPNNIERLDYLFEGGLIAPLDDQSLALTGHAFGEKQGNNRIYVATVLGLDDTNQPNAFGPLIRIGRVGECDTAGICYGSSSLLHNYTFLKSDSSSDIRTENVVGTSTEPVAFAYLSMATLGLSAGDTYYGVSVFPPDTDPDSPDLLDVRTYPDTTQEADVSPGDSADIYGGSTNLYEIVGLSGVEGRFLCSGPNDTSEPAGGLAVNLYRDSNQDGVLDLNSDALLASLPGTGSDGMFSFSGLTDDTYFIVAAGEGSDSASFRTVVIAGSRVDLSDIQTRQSCALISNGPTARDDRLTILNENLINNPDFTASISVMLNDSSADETLDASELKIISVSDSDTAELVIDGRNVLYTPNQSLLTRTPLQSSVTDTFTYTIEDAQGKTAQATVTITISRVNSTDPSCLDEFREACLFVETEVDGVGALSPAPTSVLLLLLLLRLGRTRFHGQIRAAVRRRFL